MEIFKLFGSIFVDNAEANASIAKTGKEADSVADKLRKGIGTAVKWGAGVAGAATAVVGGMLAVANKTAAAADEIDKLSERTGINREELQRWKYAAGQSGADISKLEVGIKTMSDAMDQATKGNKTASDAFNRLGVSLRNADGSARSTEAVFEDVMRALGDMEQGAERNALGNDVLGRSYVELMPLLNAGSAGMQDLKNRADELGLVMSEDAVKAGVKFGDTLDDVKQSFGAITRDLGIAFMPILQKLLDWIIEHMPQIQSMISGVFKVIGDVIGGAVTIIKGVIDVIGEVIEKAKAAWEWIKKVFSAETGPAQGAASIPDMPQLASGGIVTSPTIALIGERGPEAVIPLDQGGLGAITINETINIQGSIDSQTLRRLDDTLERRNTDLVTRLRLARPGVLP